MRPWSGRAVKAARVLVERRDLPGPCGRCNKPIDPTVHRWVVGHIRSRIAYPSLTWEPTNWRPEHKECSDRTGQEAVQEKAALDALRAHGIEPADDPFLSHEAHLTQSPLLPFSLPEDQPRPRLTSDTKISPASVTRDPMTIRPELAWDAERLRAYPWLADLVDVPADASPPLAMTPPHPEAVCSYGWSGCTHVPEGSQIVEWIEKQHKMTLRWWQRLAIVRQHEHRADGTLCWDEVVESARRRSGKSVRMRGVATWRISHADLIGEVQTVVHCGNDLPICREIQRGAWRWATNRWGKASVTVANGKEQIEAADGSRWMVKSQDAAYGYDAGLAMVDEAWDVKPDTVTEGLEPMLLDRLWAQLHITSTAHRRARSLMKSKISVPLARDDDRTLLLLWAALPQDDPGDPETWRKASPHWTEAAHRMIADKYDKALAGEDDPQADDPDPMEGFRAQYLNVWTLSKVTVVKGTPLADEHTWAQLATDAPDAVPDAAAIESWFDGGCSLALAWRLPDGAAVVAVHPAPDLAAAALALDLTGYRGALVLGKSMMGDPAAAGRKTIAGAGTALSAVLDLSRLLAEAQFAHTDVDHLSTQVLAVRTVPGADGPRMASQGRVDAVKAATWAAAAARAQVTTRPRILVSRR